MRKTLRAIVLTTIAVVGTAHAQRLPEGYPDSFQQTGKVDFVQGDKIVIGDAEFPLSPEIVVHTLYQRAAFVSNIRSGDLVGFRTGETRVIVEIWVLPDNYDLRANGRRR